MAVLVSEHDTIEYELSAYEPLARVYEPSAPVIDIPDATDKLFPNVVSVVPILVLLEALLVWAGVACYHFAMSLLGGAHTTH